MFTPAHLCVMFAKHNVDDCVKVSCRLPPRTAQPPNNDITNTMGDEKQLTQSEIVIKLLTEDYNGIDEKLPSFLTLLSKHGADLCWYVCLVVFVPFILLLLSVLLHLLRCYVPLLLLRCGCQQTTNKQTKHNTYIYKH